MAAPASAFVGGKHRKANRIEDRPVRHSESIHPATMSTKVQKLMTQPINLMFRFLQNKSRIQVWLYEQVNTRIEGRIMGFDEYMNLVLDDAEELDVKNLKRTPLGRILLKGDTITLMMAVDAPNGSN
ncbi:hypothetical protein PF005_g2198 [Phytophthora fragariae]|uniref:Small nuclear ribonucleoprotein E n=2 Tax=Phytophthora TaxID=4783 RepID=A0A6A3FUX6_9STRA|nr:hypothetical protein PF003_g20069 [Phytophthora fragariae]KAE8947900.1 hypothetical protein PF009_g2500 [Phytophthora fragariae]KAE9028301.1 hypothetical protein PF011_g1625 [Phytophthora fragariae]KAE9135876.1 hypothetical protein PF010_g1898 [Phytophthora fragariae]KAE9136265.1 hypothetical protein PF007_g2254 [Phytophthora fragariae]